MSDLGSLADLEQRVAELRANTAPADAAGIGKLIELQVELEDLKQKRRDTLRSSHLVSNPWFTAIMSPLLGAAVGVGGFYFQAKLNESNVATEQRQRDRELLNAELVSEREWRLKALAFFAEHRSVLLGPPSAEQDGLINTMTVIFPAEITGPMFARVRSTNASPATIAKFDSASARVGVAGVEGFSNPAQLVIRIIALRGTSTTITDQLRSALTAAGVPSSSVTMREERDITQFPKRSEVRYYHNADAGDATALNRFMADGLGIGSRMNARLGAAERSTHQPGELHVYVRS